MFTIKPQSLKQTRKHILYITFTYTPFCQWKNLVILCKFEPNIVSYFQDYVYKMDVFKNKKDKKALYNL